MDFSKRTMETEHAIFLSEELASFKEFVDGTGFTLETFRDMRSLGALVLNYTFPPTVSSVLIFLPPAAGDQYAAILKAVIDHLATYPTTNVYIVPPAPIKNDVFPTVIDCLASGLKDQRHPNLVYMEKSLRTIYSIGWVGDSVTGFHSTMDGFWTEAGRKAIAKFLQELLGCNWPFSQTVKDKNASEKEQRKQKEEPSKGVSKKKTRQQPLQKSPLRRPTASRQDQHSRYVRYISPDRRYREEPSRYESRSISRRPEER